MNDYPTVVTFLDTPTIANNYNAFSVMGGRFIVPEGKADIFVKRWNLPITKAMVYSPVTISKSTDGTLYASGSIAESESSVEYGGVTYRSSYDFHYAMKPSECLDPSVLEPNDIGFTSSQSSYTVTNYTNLFSNFKAYYGSAYTDAITSGRREAELTLAPLSTVTTGTTVKGFSASTISLYEGISSASGGFLFRGNSDTFSKLYLPCTSTESTVGSTNYLIAGTGVTQRTRTDGNYKFYWYYGDATYPEGFLSATIQ